MELSWRAGVGYNPHSTPLCGDEPVLREVIDEATGFLSCGRRHMILGPADEFVVIGTAEPNPTCLKVSSPKDGKRVPSSEPFLA
jgi:hypothetical protein